MKQLILNQLKKVKKATLPDNYETLREIFIPKTDTILVDSIKVGDYYLIEVEDYIIHPFDGFTLHTNWNNNIVPKDKWMNCEILQIMGKMVKIRSTGLTAEKQPTNNCWEGWLPKKSFKILKKL